MVTQALSILVMPPRRFAFALAATALFAAAPGLCAQLPRIQETITDAGLRIWHVPSEASEFTLMAFVGVGARHEDPARAGIAHVLEHCLFSVQRESTGALWQRELRSRGIDYNAATSLEYTMYRAQGSTADWPFLVEWLAGMLVRPIFLADPLDREREIVLQELAGGSPHASPSDKVVTFDEVLYPDHPLGRAVIGTPRTIRAIDVADLEQFFARHYVTGNTVVSFSGDVPVDQVVASIRAALSEYRDGDRTRNGDPPNPFVGWYRYGNKVSAAEPRTSFLRVGYHLRDRRPQSLAALLVLKRVLGEVAYQELREQRQWSYSPTADAEYHSDAWRLEFDVTTADHRKIEQVVDVLEEIVADVGNAVADPDAFDRAKRAALAEIYPSGWRGLFEATRSAWVVTPANAPVVDVFGLVAAMDAGVVESFARDNLRKDARYVFTDGGGGAFSWWSLLLLLLVVMVVDGMRGFPWLTALRHKLDTWRARPRRARATIVQAPLPRGPEALEDLDEQLREFYAKEDRDKDPPETTEV